MKTDAQIQQDVMEELKWQPFLKASEIGVAVKDGIVTLSGTVDSYAKKLAAENAAKSVAGVRAIAEDVEVQVRLIASGRKTDAEIAAAVLNALKWHSAVQEDKLKIKVEDGWVTLNGEVEWEFQKSAAREAIENLNGVRGVFNNIAIIPKIEIKNVKKQIGLAFHRSATIDADKISIESVGEKVILTGTVRSLAERKDAEHAAWLTPGVRSVENKLKVSPGVLAY